MSRRTGIHPSCRIGGPPEAREWVADRDKPHCGVLVCDDVLFSSHVTVDSGCERPTTVGPRCLLMAKVHVGHDSIIGADVEIAPCSVICGYAEVGDGAKIGANATVLPYRKVGEGAVVGAGAVVTRDVSPHTTVAGNPARQVDRNPIPFTERREAPPPPPHPAGIGISETGARV